MVKGRRKIIHPNDGFIEQLKRFERELPPPSPPQQENRFLSPQNINQRREFSTTTCSPSKQPRLDIDSILSRYEPYGDRLNATLKNPEVHFERRESFSPQKTTTTSTRLKRYSSINAEPNYLAQQSQVIMNRSRIDFSDYRPLGNAENRAETRDYSDIDKRIE